MTDYIVEIDSDIRHRMRIKSDKSIIEARDEIWEQLEEGIDPEKLGAHVVDAYVSDVTVRELYDWEKET